MITAKRTLIVVLVLGSVATAAAEHYHRTRPASRCYLPERDYQYRNFSSPKRSLSSVAVLLAADPARASGNNIRAIKSFQFVETPRLEIDHCSLSKISFLVNRTGHWSINFQADQNPDPPRAPPIDPGTAKPGKPAKDFIRRNEFFVTARVYAAQGAANPGDRLGRPLIAELNLQPFWVQKAQPQTVWQEGDEGRFVELFDLIDRVELEFKYNKGNE